MEHTVNEVFRGEYKNFLTYSWHQIFNNDIWSKKMYKLSTLPIYFTHKPTDDVHTKVIYFERSRGM